MARLTSRRVRTGLAPRPNLATSPPPTTNPSPVTPRTMPHASTLKSVQAVGVHQRDVDTGDQVVERREEDQRDQPRDGGDRGDRPAEVEARPALLRLRVDLGDRDRQQVQQRDAGQRDRDREGPPHAEQPDAQTAEDAGDHERDALDGADQAVGLVAAVVGDEQGHGGGERDVAQALDDAADQDHAGEQPEPRAAPVGQPVLAEQQPQAGRGGVGDQRDGRRDDHHLLLAVAVDERAEERAEHRREEHVAAADDRGGHHRARLEVGPEGEGEPQEARGHVGDQRVAEHLPEGAHGLRAAGHPRREVGLDLRRGGVGRDRVELVHGHPTTLGAATDSSASDLWPPLGRGRVRTTRPGTPRRRSSAG